MRNIKFNKNTVIHFVNSKVPSNTSFSIPFITTDQVSTYIKRLVSPKATGLDGPGAKTAKTGGKLFFNINF